MRIYIAGPMTGMVDSNYPNFAKAESILHLLGYSVANPTSVDDGRVHEWEWYMERTLPLVVRSDGLARLPGWDNSKGAQAEVRLAKMLRIPVRDIGHWVENSLEALKQDV